MTDFKDLPLEQQRLITHVANRLLATGMLTVHWTSIEPDGTILAGATRPDGTEGTFTVTVSEFRPNN